MSDVSIQPRELSGHYSAASRRLNSHKTQEQRETQMLRAQNMIMRAFIEDHGIDVKKVLALEPAFLSTKITLRDILIATAHNFDVPAMDIISERRGGGVMNARHSAFYLAKELTPKSLRKIGHAVGDRDHATVMHGIARVERLLKTDRNLAIILQNIRNDLLAKLYRES